MRLTFGRGGCGWKVSPSDQGRLAETAAEERGEGGSDDTRRRDPIGEAWLRVTRVIKQRCRRPAAGRDHKARSADPEAKATRVVVSSLIREASSMKGKLRSSSSFAARDLFGGWIAASSKRIGAVHFGNLTSFNTARLTGFAEESGKVSGFQPGPFAKTRLSKAFPVEAARPKRDRVLLGTLGQLDSALIGPLTPGEPPFFRATLTQRFPVSLGYCHGYRISARGDRQGLRWSGAKAPLCH